MCGFPSLFSTRQILSLIFGRRLLQDRRIVKPACGSVLIALTLLGTSGNALCATPRYSLEEVNLTSDANTRALNSNSQVTGRLLLYGGSTRAFFYSDGSTLDLGTLGGQYSWGYDVNELGQVVGESSTSDEADIRAFMYSGGVMHDLGTLGGSSASATAINSNGQVCGASFTGVGEAVHAFLYSDGVMRDLGTLGGNRSEGIGINIHGQVTGESELVDYPTKHAFIYSDGAMQDIGTLRGGNISIGYGINDKGEVTGISDGVSPEGDYFLTHAFLYSDGTMRDLGTLGGYSSYAAAINNKGHITGYSGTALFGQYHAFLYADGKMHDLNDLIDPDDPLAPYVTLVLGVDINDEGVILAEGDNTRTGRFTAYLVKPQQGTDGDGGGGAVDLRLVLLLAAAGFMKRRTKSKGRFGSGTA